MEEKKSSERNQSRSESSGQGTAAIPARESDLKSTSPGVNKHDAGTALDKAKDTATTLLDQAKATANDAYNTVVDKAASSIDEQKSGLTGGLTSVADTVRRVSGTLTDGESQNSVTEKAAKYTESAAQKLEQAAHYFEQTDLRGMEKDVESYARRNPAIFLGAAFALGVLAARFLKSGTSSSLGSANTSSDRGPAGKRNLGEAKSNALSI